MTSVPSMPAHNPFQAQQSDDPSIVVCRTSCPACGSLAAKTIVRLPYDQPPMSSYIVRYYEGRANPATLAGYVFDLLRCRDCGMAYQKNVPTGALLQAIYDEWIPPDEREKMRDSYSLDTYRYMAAEMDFLLQYFNKHPFQTKVFDFGCGWSEWARMAGAFGCDITGSELSKERISYAQSLGIKVIDWGEIPGQQFDFINTEQVFEHLVDPESVLVHLVKALRRGGLLKISVPNCANIDKAVAYMKSEADWSWEPLVQIQPIEHLNCFTYDSLVKLASRAGLRPVTPSVFKLWNASSGWLHPLQAARNFLRPLYRHIYPRSTYIFFAHTS